MLRLKSRILGADATECLKSEKTDKTFGKNGISGKKNQD
jgi:hypothetical protein